MDPLSITRYSLHGAEKPPPATICIVGGTNVAHALAISPHVSAAFTLETPLGLSPTIYYGEFEGVPFYHVTLHGSSTEKSGVVEHDSLLTVWSTLHYLNVSNVLGGATAGSINSAYKLGDWVIADDFIDFNIETAAEIRMFKQLGGDLVTMNVPTEMAYARQLNMNYSSLIAISNPAEGLGTWDWKTLSDLYPRLHAQSIEIYLAAIRRIHHLPERRRIGDTLRVHPDFD
jgi:purine nucleoside phosphorylase